jgi:hypothetical protein
MMLTDKQMEITKNIFHEGNILILNINLLSNSQIILKHHNGTNFSKNRKSAVRTISSIARDLSKIYKFKKVFLFGESKQKKYFSAKIFRPVQFKMIKQLSDVVQEFQSENILLVSEHSFQNCQTISVEEFWKQCFEDLCSNKYVEFENWLCSVDKISNRVPEKELKFESSEIDKSLKRKREVEISMEEKEKIEIKTIVFPDKEEEVVVNFRKAMELKKIHRQKHNEKFLGTGEFDETEDLVQRLKNKMEK